MENAAKAMPPHASHTSNVWAATGEQVAPWNRQWGGMKDQGEMLVMSRNKGVLERDGKPCPPRPESRRCILRWVIAASLVAAALPQVARAEGQVQLHCTGTLLEARGQAEQQRGTARLKASLNLEAEAETSDQALELLQQRLASVRSALQALSAEELRVSSPATWQRPRERGQAALVQANLQVTANLAPARLQTLIRNVGALPGVRLAPVATEADRNEDAQIRRQLLGQAYRDALNQAQPLASLIGRDRLTPLDIRIDGQEMAVPAMRAMTADAAPPFNPDELSRPRERLTMLVRFCAQ
jgi:uncharacterized protein YggE